MKKLMAAALLALVSTALFAADSNFGAQGAEGKKGLSLEQMLVYAIQDEYLARAEYEAIMARHGNLRPFSNIIRAEEQHIAWLKEVFAKYALTVPADSAKGRVTVPAALKEALETGVQADDDAIVELLRERGGAAGDGARVVRIPRETVTAALQQCPREVTAPGTGRA